MLASGELCGGRDHVAFAGLAEAPERLSSATRLAHGRCPWNNFRNSHDVMTQYLAQVAFFSVLQTLEE